MLLRKATSVDKVVALNCFSCLTCVWHFVFLPDSEQPSSLLTDLGRLSDTALATYVAKISFCAT